DALWTMICMFREHGLGLLDSPTKTNFKSMEINGLAHVGLMFPELSGAHAFASTAIDRAIAEVDRQFYDDGTHLELAPAYGRLALLMLDCTLRLAKSVPDTSHDPYWIPPRTWRRLGDAAEALMRIAVPDGTCPPLHDSEAIPVDTMRKMFAQHLDAARFAR